MKTTWGAPSRSSFGIISIVRPVALAAALGGSVAVPAEAQTAEANYWLSRIFHTRTHFVPPYPLPPRRHRVVAQAAAYRPSSPASAYCGAPCASIPILLGVGF